MVEVVLVVVAVVDYIMGDFLWSRISKRSLDVVEEGNGMTDRVILFACSIIMMMMMMR